jgi:hypothetical protein
MAAAVAGLGVAGSIRLVHAAAGDRTWPYYAYAPDVCEDDPPKKKAVPVPPLQILYGGTRSDALGMLASLGVENAEKSLPKDKEAVRISNNSWVVAAGDHPVHEWLLALKDPAGPDRMFVAAWVKDGTYYIEVGYAVAQDNNPTHESGFLLMGNATPSVVAEIVKRVQAALPNLAKNPERYKPRACVRLLQWEDMVSGQTADALRASERERQAAENRQIDSSSPVYTLAAYGVKTHGRSYRAPTCSPVLGITPSVLTEAAKDTKPRGCRNSLLTSCPDWWSISCTYEVPERLLVETMKKLVQDGLRFRLGTVGNTPKTEELVASATTKYERIVCAQPPDAEVPVAWHDEDVDCGKVAEKAEEEFLSDVPSPEDILLAIKTHKPCKLAMTEIEWRRISSNVAPSKKDRKPATCGNRDFLISYPIVVHDGTKKNYGARECSGISAFTDDNAGERQFYTLGFTVRNKATTTMSLAIQDFLFVARDPGSPLSADTISIAKYHPRATRLACQDAHVRVDAGEEEEIEITYLSAKHRPWLLVNPKAGLYIDISDTVFEDPSRMMRGHPDHGIKAQ